MSIMRNGFWDSGLSCRCSQMMRGCSHCSVSFLCIPPIAARVCDNELLRCQNGGVCVNNVRCNCPAAYTGLQCEKRRCETELGGCGGPNSGHVRLRAPSSAALLLLLLASCWAAIL